ncbi:MAG: hypothetical protein EPO68_17360 [Planctomycetota bacterium]|nr:MAG: hypothetical protein EPO68_17360 [Planctomycetota bacterium]
MQGKSISDTDPSAHKLSDGLTDVGHAVEAAARDEYSRWKRMLETGKERATEWKGGLESNIRSKPIQSVLIAAALGAVVGIIFSRRSR